MIGYEHALLATAIAWLVLNPMQKLWSLEERDESGVLANVTANSTTLGTHLSTATKLSKPPGNTLVLVLAHCFAMRLCPRELPTRVVHALGIIGIGCLVGAAHDFVDRTTCIHVNGACRLVHAIFCVAISLTWLGAALALRMGRPSWLKLRLIYAVDGLVFVASNLMLLALGPPPAYVPGTSTLGAGMLRGCTTLALTLLTTPRNRWRLAAIGTDHSKTSTAACSGR